MDEVPAVQTCGLSFSLIPGGLEQLREVSWSLPQGARCVLVGQNGAGKSTLLELLSGSKMAPSGTIKILGEDPFRGSAGRKVALVQGGWRGGGGAYDSLGEDKVAFLKVWQLLGLSGPELPAAAAESAQATRADRLYEALGLRRLIDRYCGSLSDGERRKAELARKLIEPREVVLLDEATTDLDLLSRRALLDFLKADGATVVSVTHVFDGLESWATHLAHLHDGALLRCEALQTQGPAPWHAEGGLFPLVARWLAEAPTEAVAGVQLPPMPAAAPWCASPGPVVHVAGLAFAYAPWSPPALCVDQLEIPAGCRCVLVGPNGAGKSSLLSILAGRRMVSQGDVQVVGCEPFHGHVELNKSLAILSSEWKRQVAEIGAGRALSFRELASAALTDLVAVGADMQLLAARMLRLIQMLGIDPTKPIGSLSDGMMRRVQIALKLLRPSKVLLVDEVTADLDVLARNALLSFLREESEAGTCVIYCTHILDGLGGWASHLLRLRPGAHQGELRQLEPSEATNLFQIVMGFLEEDAALPEPVPVLAQRSAGGGGSGEELPHGWHNRGSTQAGAYGAYAWNVDKGSEDTWSFASAAPPPPSMQQAIARSVQLQQQAAFAGGGMAGGFPGGAGNLGGGYGGGACGQPLAAATSIGDHFGNAVPDRRPVAALPPSASAGDNPFGPGRRQNTMPYEALVSAGAIQPDRPHGY